MVRNHRNALEIRTREWILLKTMDNSQKPRETMRNLSYPQQWCDWCSRCFPFLTFQSFSIPARVTLGFEWFLAFFLSFFLRISSCFLLIVDWCINIDFHGWNALAKAPEIIRNQFVRRWLNVKIRYVLFFYLILWNGLNQIWKVENVKDLEKRHMIDPASMYVYVRVAIWKKIDVGSRLIVFRQRIND